MIVKIQASIRWELESCYLLNIRKDGSDTINFLFSRHRRPLLVELNAYRVFHNNIFAADGV